MTIAACYLSTEGVVLGADSTTTMFVAAPGPQGAGVEHQFDFAQKIFQIGTEGTLAIAMWGLGSFGTMSYRTMIANFADTLTAQSPVSMHDVASRWSRYFWDEYSNALSPYLARAKELISGTQRTPADNAELEALRQTFSGGFCIGGCCLPDRTPKAFEVTYSPEMTGPGIPQPQSVGSAKFWGCPNLIHRLLYGIDFGILEALIQSGKWTGSQQDLFDVVTPHFLGQPMQLPIREAIDWVHASIYATIKTMKFSHMAPVCSGPIEVGVITTDRPFRWVRHKRLDAAVAHDGFVHV